MNAHILCLALTLSAAAPSAFADSIYTPNPQFVAVIRGQDPRYDPVPQNPTPIPSGPTFGGPVPSSSPPIIQEQPYVPMQPYQEIPAYPPPMMPQQMGPRPGALAGPYGWGANGPQPYRLGGIVARYDFGYLAPVGSSGADGDFGVFEFDMAWKYSERIWWDWVLSITPEFGLRTWDGPRTPAGSVTSLPGEAFRFGGDFELATPQVGPWSATVAFNPSLNTDFNNSISSNAFNWDGRGIVFFRESPHWLWAFGAGYWDRVHSRVIPYAGAVWNPDDRWEFRLVLPQPRISYFLGNSWGLDTWMYARAEYHVEAYEIDVPLAGRRDRVEIADYRILIGYRRQNNAFGYFLEAGWVFGRDVEYARGTPGFDPSTGFIARGGLRF